MSFKIGDEVICIKKGQWLDLFGEVLGGKNPEYNETCIIANTFRALGKQVLIIKGYAFNYFAYRFVKASPHTFTNKITKELAGSVKEEKGIERIKTRELETI